MLLYLLAGAVQAATPQDFALSMSIPPADVVNASLSSDASANDVLTNLGVVLPTEGSDFGMLYTGSIGTPPQSGTDLGAYGESGDRSTLSFDLSVPAGVNSARFDFFFLSAEYPEFVGTQFNDKFEANVVGSAYTGNAAIDNQGNLIGVNSVFFSVVDAASLQGTGFDASDPYSNELAGGGTGWLTIMVPVTPEENVNFSFVVYDVADGIYDSAVLLDNFNWSETEIELPTIIIPININYLSPKRSTTDGGITTTIHGTGFNSSCVSYFDGTEALSTTFIDSTQLEAVVPPHDVGLVDVTVDCSGIDDTLVGGFTYYEDNTGDSPPELNTVSPFQVYDAGGEVVTVSGLGFEDGAVISIEGTDLSTTFVDSSTLTFTTPPHSVGFVDLKVTNPNTLSDTLAGGLYYIPLPEGEDIPEQPSEEEEIADTATESDEEELDGTPKESGGTCSSASPVDWSWVAFVGVGLAIRRRRK